MTNAISVLDVGLGAAGRVLALTRLGLSGVRVTAHRVRPVTGPVMAVSRQAPLPSGLRPAHWLVTLAGDGANQRRRLLRELTAVVDVLVPTVLAEVLARVDLTDLVTRYVDLDAVVAAVDLERAVRRVDVDAVVARADLDAILDRVDVDAVVARADLDAILDRVDVDAVIARADLDAVLERVDVDAVVARADLDAILDRVDVDGVVARADLRAVVDRLDLTSLVLERVDLDAVVQAVLSRIDLIGLAEQVIDGVNLAEIIRESTGTMASDTVQEVRMQGIAADDAVSHAMDRFLLRHGRRSTKGPAELEPHPPQVGVEDLTADDHRSAPRERVP